MIIDHNVDLSRKTTFRVGGTARNFYTPQSEDELIALMEQLEEDYMILSGGSNLLINQRVFRNVIYMNEVDNSIHQIKDGCFYIGASNRIQKVISELNRHGYGGFEELIGLPALFGGIIYMNAGIGGRDNTKFNIADFITDVKAVNRKTKKSYVLKKDECDFSYRKSVFQNDEYVILGAHITAFPGEMNDFTERIRKRKEYIQEHQEYGKGCFGTCYSRCSRPILRICRKMNLHKGNVRLSRSNANWLVNEGDGSFSDAMYIIDTINKLHRLCRQQIELEVRIWR